MSDLLTLNCSSLETFDLMNCSEYTKTIDLSGSPYIQNVYLNGSGVTSLVLPVGGMLKELRLPRLESQNLRKYESDMIFLNKLASLIITSGAT